MTKQAAFDFDQQTIATGEQLRNTAIDRVVSHADTLRPNWSQDAYKVLLQFISVKDGEFMAEDLRAYAESQKNFTAPGNLRAWGGPMVKAKNAGLIEAVGTRKVNNAKAHCANATVWRIKEKTA